MKPINPLNEIILKCAEFSGRPLDFVYWNYSWGEGELVGETGPDEWQTEILLLVQEGLLTVDDAIQIAIASGHGIGKSALVAWLLDWAQSTLEDTMGVVTANTETQLKTKTWAQLAKWHRLGLTRFLFKMTATARFSLDPEHSATWRIDMIPWSEQRPEAFAGLHNKGKRIILVFDEASAIPNIIWETASGALTDSDTQILWFAFGNPTKATGRFRDCFPGGKEAHRWISKQIDSRTVRITNKKVMQEWVDDWGPDSDYVRVRVLGQFPKIGLDEFISRAAVEEAMKRELLFNHTDPMVLGCDVGRFGDDPSVIYPRKGRDARSFKIRKFLGLSTMEFAYQIILAAQELEADAVFVDGTGVGGGVVDRCRELGLNVFDVQFGAGASKSPFDGTRYLNKRAEMWGSVKFALPGLCLPPQADNDNLIEELCGVMYSFTPKEGKIQLESKKDMKARGLPSPNVADALALTYAYPVLAKIRGPGARLVEGVDYDPYRSAA